MFILSLSFPRQDGVSRTSPFASLLLRLSFRLWEAAELLQRADGALTHHGLPPKLTVIDDFDDDRRHVKVLDGESLGRDGTDEVSETDETKPKQCIHYTFYSDEPSGPASTKTLLANVLKSQFLFEF